MNFEPTQRQREFMENPSRIKFIPPRYPYGKRAMQEELIRIEAADEHEAESALKDLHESGIAMMDKGKRVEPRTPRSRAKSEFDEITPESHMPQHPDDPPKPSGALR